LDQNASLHSFLKSAPKQFLGKSLYNFDRYGLELDLMREQPHREMCEFAEELFRKVGQPGQDRGIIMVPRDCFKTTSVSIGGPMYCLSEIDPNLAILIDTHSHEFSKQILSEIKWKYERGDAFREHYGDYVSNATQWSEEAIKINKRTTGRKEPSIDTSGVDRAKTGGHYDIIIADDLHNEKNIDVEGMRLKVRRHVQTLLPILSPNGVLIIVCTRWHYGDVYGWLLAQDDKLDEKGKARQYSVLHRAAEDDGGNLYFPERLTREFLEIKKEELEDRWYSCWYMNSPIEEQSKIFPKIYLEYFDGEYRIEYVPYLEVSDCAKRKGDRVPLYVTLTWDPAGRKGGMDADYHGIVVNGEDEKGNWWILEAEQRKGKPSDIVDHVLRLIYQYQPRRISVEDVGGHGLFIDLLAPEMRARGMHIPINEYHPGTRQNKNTRIATLQPRFKKRSVFIRRGLKDLVTQLSEFPQLEHDDIIDALKQVESVSQKADPYALAPLVLTEEEFDAPGNDTDGGTSRYNAYSGM
jgi:predicted phage terminase large subunit-like protein